MSEDADHPAERALTSAEHDAANGALGFRFVRALAVEKAALDRGLPVACTFILAAISYFMNATNKRAWPNYRTLADLTGYSEDTIDKSIRELKRVGYLFTERRAPITGGRAIVHYGLCSIRPREIDEMVTAAVDALRRRECSKSDSAEKSGVRQALTPPEIAGSASADPAKFPASDPAKFRRQKPYREEPSYSPPTPRTRGARESGSLREVLDEVVAKRPECRRAITGFIEPLVRLREFRAPDRAFALTQLAMLAEHYSDDLLAQALQRLTAERGCVVKPSDVEKALKAAPAGARKPVLARPSHADDLTAADPATVQRGVEAAELLRAKLGEDVYGSWFASLAFERVEGDRVVASICEPFIRRYVQQHYAAELDACAAAVFGAGVRVELIQRTASHLGAA